MNKQIVKVVVVIAISVLAITGCSKNTQKAHKVYQRFLEGKEKLYFDKCALEGINGSDGLYLNEFYEKLTLSPDGEHYNYSTQGYNYIDCGSDGEEELVIRFSIYDEKSDLEGSYDYEVVIKNIDNKLEYCGEAVSHYRLTEYINDAGVILSSYSDFAGLNFHHFSRGIDKNGDLYELMTSTASTGEAIPGMYFGDDKALDFTSVYADHKELFNSVTIISTDLLYGEHKGERIYTYDIEGDNFLSEAEKIVVETFEKANVTLYSYEDFIKIEDELINEWGLDRDTFYFSPHP